MVIFYVVLLAMVAGFLALRLYSVLGRRTGHEQPLPRAADERPVALTVPRATEAAAEPREPLPRPIDTGAEAGLRAIVSGEPGFDVPRFIDGAKAAYRMVLEAFWAGDEAALTDLVEPSVAGAFADAIRARRDAGETLENRLVSIERTQIVEAGVVGKAARIAVRFDADIAAVTRDAEGAVIAGSMTDAVEVREVWTFARQLKSADPNWKLAETDEA